MPNATVLESKKAIVKALAEKMSKAQAGVLVDYKGINVADDTNLRRSLREKDIDYAVVKNTLTRFACDEIGFKELDPVLNGTTAMAVSMADPIVCAKLICDYAKKNPKFTVKAGFVEGTVISADEVKRLASLGNKETLLATVLGTMMAPISSLAYVISQIAEQKNGGALPAEEAEAPAAEEAAPAEEAPAAE